MTTNVVSLLCVWRMGRACRRRGARSDVDALRKRCDCGSWWGSADAQRRAHTPCIAHAGNAPASIALREWVACGVRACGPPRRARGAAESRHCLARGPNRWFRRPPAAWCTTSQGVGAGQVAFPIGHEVNRSAYRSPSLQNEYRAQPRRRSQKACRRFIHPTVSTDRQYALSLLRRRMMKSMMQRAAVPSHRAARGAVAASAPRRVAAFAKGTGNVRTHQPTTALSALRDACFVPSRACVCCDDVLPREPSMCVEGAE